MLITHHSLLLAQINGRERTTGGEESAIDFLSASTLTAGLSAPYPSAVPIWALSKTRLPLRVEFDDNFNGVAHRS